MHAVIIFATTPLSTSGLSDEQNETLSYRSVKIYFLTADMRNPAGQVMALYRKRVIELLTP